MNERIKKQAISTTALIFVLTVLAAVGACFLYKKSLGNTLQISVFSAIFSFFLIFIYDYEFRTQSLDYDNNEHPFRFLLIYSVSLLFSILFPLINRGGWLFVSLAISLALFSNMLTGLTASVEFIALSTMLTTGADLYTFLVYFLAGLIGIAVFRKLDEDFQVISSLILTMICLFILETAGFIFLENQKLSVEQFIYPIVNVFINAIFLFIVLKYFNEKIANRYRNRYLELNDQEYSALIKLKELDKNEYMRSIHTAYLAERIATACDCNVPVAKNLALYHKVKKVFNYSEEALLEFVTDNQFPPDAAKALIEYSDRDRVISTKEESIVYLSDKLISTLMLIFERNKSAQLDIIDLIDALFAKESIVSALSESDISLNDINKTKSIMKKEVLYYDFLR